jgi:hypothetical protein
LFIFNSSATFACDSAKHPPKQIPHMKIAAHMSQPCTCPDDKATHLLQVCVISVQS